MKITFQQKKAITFYMREKAYNRLCESAKKNGRTRKKEAEMRLLEHLAKYTVTYESKLIEVDSDRKYAISIQLPQHIYENITKLAALSGRTRAKELEIRILSHMEIKK